MLAVLKYVYFHPALNLLSAPHHNCCLPPDGALSHDESHIDL